MAHREFSFQVPVTLQIVRTERARSNLLMHDYTISYSITIMEVTLHDVILAMQCR